MSANAKKLISNRSPAVPGRGVASAGPSESKQASSRARQVILLTLGLVMIIELAVVSLAHAWMAPSQDPAVTAPVDEASNPHQA